MKIKEVMESLSHRDMPLVEVHTTIEELIRVMVRFPHTRLAYVVDGERRLMGTITVGSLMRHVLPHHYAPGVHGRSILRDITADSAGKIMDKEDIYASLNEPVELVLERMAQTGVKEMAVVDMRRRVVGDVTAIDLLGYFILD